MLTLNQVSALSEDEARETIERILWPNGPVCPHCGNMGGWKIEGARAGLYKCTAYKCGEQFTVTVKSVFESSKVPLTKWLMAVHLLCASKKGISSHQLSRMLNVTYKTAWFMSHRIRHAMSAEDRGLMGSGGAPVEVDETYFGKTKGQGEEAHLSKKEKIVALLERGGCVHSFHVQPATAIKNWAKTLGVTRRSIAWRANTCAAT